MRVSAKVKEKTQERILRVARKLFSTKGFDETTTRDIAARAGIAVGTLFNYFNSKEELGMTLLAEALESAKADFLDRRRGDESLDESLFSYVATGLRRLQPYRNYVGAVIESGMSPLTASKASDLGERLRADHLETVAGLVASLANGAPPSLVTMHLYWTLYLGILAFWSGDDSPDQEDTLAVADQSLRLFVTSLSSDTHREEVPDDA